MERRRCDNEQAEKDDLDEQARDDDIVASIDFAQDSAGKQAGAACLTEEADYIARDEDLGQPVAPDEE